MKRIGILVLILILTGCVQSTEDPHIADPDDHDPYCPDPQVYYDGACRLITEPDDYDWTMLFTTYYNALKSNPDFENTWFEAEAEYYQSFFHPDMSYTIARGDVIDYNVERLIFHEGAIRAERLTTALEILLLEDSPTAGTTYQTDQLLIRFDRDDDILQLEIEQPIVHRNGSYTIGIDEQGLVYFDALEESFDTPFSGTVLQYVLYHQDTQYLERFVIDNHINIHLFEYDYSFTDHTASTALVTWLPREQFYDVARSERHFNDGYYVVYSKGTGYEQKYFTLFHNHHGSLHGSDMTIEIGEEPLRIRTLSWNLMDVTGWDYIADNQVYLTTGQTLDIIPFSYLEFPYFGPEFNLEVQLSEPFTDEAIAHPGETLSYDVYTFSDCTQAIQRLEELSSQFDADETSYTWFGETYALEQDFTLHLLAYVSPERLALVQTMDLLD